MAARPIPTSESGHSQNPEIAFEPKFPQTTDRATASIPRHLPAFHRLKMNWVRLGSLPPEILFSLALGAPKAAKQAQVRCAAS
jgi:hypothetical protein